MCQVWENLLFAHWPIPADSLRKWVPEELSIDTFDGTAWLGITPFQMRRVRARGLPPLPGFSAFPELNVRTYIAASKPGVYFFSLDAGNRLAVIFARQFFHLPYFGADMRVESFGGGISYRSRRLAGRGAAAELDAYYEASGNEFRSIRGTLEHFLTERYCLYAVENGQVFRTEIHHARWPLQPARAEIRGNTMAEQIGLTLSDQPSLLHYARRLAVRVWLPQRLRAFPDEN